MADFILDTDTLSRLHAGDTRLQRHRERFDPAESPLPIPTPLVFIAVEKTPHRFQINNWSARFDRGAIEERLQTWCTLYRMTHKDMGVWLEDANVRVYAIRRPPGEMTRLADGRTR